MLLYPNVTDIATLGVRQMPVLLAWPTTVLSILLGHVGARGWQLTTI